MKCVRVCVLAAAIAAAAMGASAQDGAVAARDDAARSKDAMAPSGMPGETPGASPSRAAPRPGMFAAASAALAKRMTAEQREERRFLKEASANGRFEFEAARMAVGKAANPAVRSFASTLVAHQSELLPALQYMLHARGLAPPMLANDQRRALNHLAKINGAKFDREFLEKAGLRSQLASVQLFERAAAMTKDPALKAWIEKILPGAKMELANAERAAASDLKLARSGLLRAPVLRQSSRSMAPSPMDHANSNSTQVMGSPATPAPPPKPVSPTR